LAMYALRDEITNRRVTGVVCMSTPFIECSPRKWHDVLNSRWSGLLASQVLSVLAIPVVLVVAVALYNLFGDVPVSRNSRTVYWLAALSALLYGGLVWTWYRGPFWQRPRIHYDLADWINEKVQAIMQRLAPPLDSAQKVFVVSVKGDEALWWLTRIS